MPRSSRRASGTGGGGGGGGGLGGRRWRSRSRSQSRPRRPISSDTMERSVADSTTSGAVYHNADSGASTDGNVGFVTSPPQRKSGLTGNISSLFRRASGHGGGGGGGSERDHYGGGGQQQQHQATYQPPSTTTTSPRSSSKSRQTSQQTRGRGSTAQQQQSPQILPPPRSPTHEGGSAHNRLFYSNVDDDSDDSFESRSRSGLSHHGRTQSGAVGGGRRGGGGTRSSSSRRATAAAAAAARAPTPDTYSSEADTSYTGSSAYASQSASGTFMTGSKSGMTGSSRHERSTVATGDITGVTSVTESTENPDDDGGGGGGGKPQTTILRFRGFSTSIQNLFLDEALVCASMGCFGLILSNRTEYLLQLRNDRRGVQWGRSSSRRTLPSRIVAYALLLTLLLIGITFVVWGFGTDSEGKGNALFTGFGKNGGGGSSSSSGSNSNDSGGSGQQWDDHWDARGVDDDLVDDQNQYYQNNDDAAANANYNDDGNANQNDDGGNANYNDDGNANANYNYNDDGNVNAANDDGGNANYNDDGGNAANDDDGNNWYNNYNNNGNAANDDGGYYYGYNDDTNRQRQLDKRQRKPSRQKKAAVGVARRSDGSARQAVLHHVHAPNGIFKIREMKECLWEPAIDFLQDEWFRPYEKTQTRDLEYDGTNYESTTDGSKPSRDLASDLRISLMIAFLIVLGILGRRRRMRTRYYLVRARAQEDHLFYASSGTGIKRVGFQDSREDQYEGACSHTLCGCYPVDPPRDGDEIDDEVQVSDEGVAQRKKKPHNLDCVGRGFNCLTGLCCGLICKCWFQCLSICALAQEAREIRLLVPTRYQRIDYITHQPFHEYQKVVNDIRRGWLGKTRKKSGFMPHFHALSRLSRYVLVASILVVLVLVGTLLFNPRASFSWPDAVILMATFLQSFLVIWVVHWIFHKSDLSLDAVIKFFAAGFVIAVPASFFFEGLLVNITLTTAYLVYAIGQLISGETFVEWVVQHYRLLWILGEIFNAYVVAAVVEELCKYYTFRCVEHPDLLFLTGLVSSAHDQRATEGGVVKYPFSSHQVQKTNMKTPYDDDMSVHSSRSHRSTRSVKGLSLDPNPSPEEFVEEELDIRTYRQKAAAVTTAMISVAVGLACAENCLYVFLLGGTTSGSADSETYVEEWIVLLFRSIFPVHALAAAMQSVNMIRKFVETDDVNGHRIGVGRIILPAVVMHGSFDAILLGINVFIETAWDDYLDANAGDVDPDNPPYNPAVVNGVAWLSIIVIMASGLFWYFRENRAQRLRLILLEEQEKARENGSSLYTSPRHASDIEIV